MSMKLYVGNLSFSFTSQELEDLFAEHGNTLVSSGQDGTLKIWRGLPFEKITLSAR